MKHLQFLLNQRDCLLFYIAMLSTWLPAVLYPSFDTITFSGISDTTLLLTSQQAQKGEHINLIL